MKTVTFALVISLFAGSTAFAQETPPSSGTPDDLEQLTEPVEPVALLLPAIQIVREAASKPKPKTSTGSSSGNSGSQHGFVSNGPAMSRENPEG